MTAETGVLAPPVNGTAWGPPFVDPSAHGADPAPPPSATSVREPAARARWERPALVGLLLVTAALYLWGLSASGWANSFYSAAAQAGSQSWKAWFFGSSDAANSITVDKPPASLWVMGLSVRLFGLSSWSLLVPQALMGVGTVGVVYAIVRRRTAAWAALLAGAALAVTPVAVLMFRFNNPDALLTLLMAVAAWAVLRGVEDGRRRWILIAGAAIGFGFLTKQLQVLLVVPALALAYLVAAPGRWWRRVGDVALGGAAMVVAAGWWLAAVELWPASSRPYIGGSQDNSILELTLGYNGLGRLTGNETGSVGGGGGNGGGMWGETGLTRMIDGVIGGQIAWLLPAALGAIVVGLWVTRRRPRTDPTRAAVIVLGGWLVVTALVFSEMQGIFHEYYTVALAPPIAGLVGLGAFVLWQRRAHVAARAVLAGGVVLTALWSAALLGRAAGWNPWLAPAVVVLALVAAGLLVAAGSARRARLAVAGGLAAVVAVLAGPTAYAIETATTPHSGSIVTAGPAVSGGGPGGRGGFPGGAQGPGNGRFPGGGQAPPTGNQGPANGGSTNGRRGTFPGGTAGATPGGGGAGGLLDAAEVSAEVRALLLEDADDYTWVAAAVGSNRASGFQVATERPVMPVGGFNGTDPSPTLAEFQQLVADGEIHWFVGGGGFGGQMGGSDSSAAIAEWVSETFEAVTVDGVTMYDLS